MYKFFDRLSTDDGKALPGYQVRIMTTEPEVAVDIFADESGTPIESVSGVANAAITDNGGNYQFFVEPGTYNIVFSSPGGTFLDRIRAVPMLTGPKGDTGDTGGPRALDDLDDLGPALVSDKAFVVDEATFTWKLGNFVALAASAPDSYRASDYFPLSTGAWVRQGADKVNYDGKQSVGGKLDRLIYASDARFAGGAVADGTSDATAAIQAALDFAGTVAPAVVNADDGIQAYLVDELTVPTGVTFRFNLKMRTPATVSVEQNCLRPMSGCTLIGQIEGNFVTDVEVVERGVFPAEDGVSDVVLDVAVSVGGPIASPPVTGPIALISLPILRAAAPERSEAQLEPWIEPIRTACQRFEINNIRRIAAFIAQMAHESNLIPGREENLNYSAARLTQVWPSRFPTIAVASAYAGNPQKLANRVYANRMGNGDEASGDGYKFRGAGPGQLTGRDNWTRFAAAMGMTVEAALAYGRSLLGGVMSFGWFWSVNGLNGLADTKGVEDETRRINGGLTGLADRKARFDRVVAQLLILEGRQ